MHFDIIHFIKTNYFLVFALIGVGILYFLLNKLFGEKKQKPDEENEDDEEIVLKEPKKEPEINRHKINKGYTEHSSSYMSEARQYGFIPKDGSSVRVSNYNRKQKIDNTNKNKNEFDDKEQIYTEIFYVKMIENLSEAAKYAKLPNDQLLSDLKTFKKKGKFRDVDIDIINNKIIYTNTILDRNEQVFYAKDETAETKENNGGVTLENGMKMHKCPFCGTENIADANTKKYNCYYCLKEVIIK